MERRELLHLLGAAIATPLLGHARASASPLDPAARAASPAPAPAPASASTLQIAMLAYPMMTALDLVGPQLFLAVLPGAQVHIVARTLDPVPCDTGFSIVPTATLADCPATVDVLFVPGGSYGTVAAMRDHELLDFVARRGRAARWVTSVCTGALVLGAAGLLRGYRATTHWVARDVLATVGATAVDERVVIDRNRVTGAGVSAGLDLGLALAMQLRGTDVARVIALNAEYAPEPPLDAGTPDTAGPAATEALRASYAPVLAAMQEAARDAQRAGRRFAAP